MKRRIFIILAILGSTVAVVTAIVIAALWHPSTGVDVTVMNRGPGAINDVEVQVKGHVYPLGQLAPKASATGRLETAGESDIDVEFRDAEGVWHAVNSNVYIDRGYRGKVTIELERNAVSRVTQHVAPASK